MSQYDKIVHLLRDAFLVHLRPYWKLHFLMGLAVIVTVLFETCFPLTIKFLIDKALLPHDSEKFIAALVVLAALFALSAAARATLAVIRAYMHKEIYWDMSTGFFRLLERLPLSYFDHLPPGHFSPLFDTELITYSNMTRDLFTRGFHAVLQFTVIIGTMFVMNWQLALVVTVLLPLVVFRPQRRLGPTLDGTDRIRRVVERINSAVQDYVATQTLVRAFGRGKYASDRFTEDFAGRKGPRSALRSREDIRRTLKTPHFMMQTFKLSMDNQQAGITLVVIAGGAWLSYAGSLTLGAFSAFILLLPVVMGAISRIADYLQDLGRATLSLERLEAVANAALPESRAQTSINLKAPARGIEFEQISFGYTKDNPIIRDVNLMLPVGESVAFVGRSGAGKSTLLRLLLGFYEPTSGRVAIDGHDIREIDPASRGAQFGTVLQHSPLINSTVRSNICFAKPDASDEEIANAARLAGIHDFIVSLPKGYDSEVGEGGKWFSEGQRQRIALARAILPQPAVLLLDEVTSALDPETESAINGTFQQLARERTVMLVTHRLASAAFVDRIVVIDQGRIAEQGRHEELMARGGLYRQFWEMQTGFVVSGDGHHAEVSGERLRAIPLFRDVDLNILEALADRFVSRFYQPGESIYTQGDPGEKFYIVVRGTISISMLDATGQSIRLADLQDGDYFGEVEMVNKGRRTTTVKARMPSLILALDAEHFVNMVEEVGSLGKVVTQMALGRSLSAICSVGRRRRSHPVWNELIQHTWQ